jgi:type VI secretion system secreted protein VgrG
MFKPRVVVVLAATVLAMTPSLAQQEPAAEYPQRPVKVIVSTAPGGGVDTVTRIFAAQLQHRLGQPFVIELELGSADYDIAYKDILGDHLTIEIEMGDGEHRYLDGIVTRFIYAGLTDFEATYHVTLRPWLWLLTRHVQCKIFQGKTVPDIIKEIFRSAKFDDLEDKLRRSDYVTLDYCVQYRESDFAFVSRLMEQEGIYYFFKHEDGKHKLVLCDGTTSHGKYADKYGEMRIL